jgi:hypothetical protein
LRTNRFTDKSECDTLSLAMAKPTRQMAVAAMSIELDVELGLPEQVGQKQHRIEVGMLRADTLTGISLSGLQPSIRSAIRAAISRY